jgi:hypothetical protein
MPTSGLLRWSGVALAAGGALTLLLNAALTPRLPAHAPLAETAASPLFVWRQSVSALAALGLLFGAVGLHLRQAARAGRFGALAFALAFLGGALLFAMEWGEVFVVHPLAVGAPQALAALEPAHGPGLYDIGSMIAFSAFALGWILLAIATLRARVLPRPAAWLVIGGLFATPLLGAVLHVWGAVAGNAILGAGWFWLGLKVARARSGAG